MEQENFAELFNKFGKMMENGEIPENIKNMFNNNSPNSNQNSFDSSFNTNSENNSDNSYHSANDGNSFNMDFETIMKIQQIMSSLKNDNNDARTNLLLSLKPYLKENRKQKIEQYINIFKMTKILDMLNKTGGDNAK